MSADRLKNFKVVGIGINSITCLACAIAILLIIFLKAYKNFLIRLVLYLNLTILCLMLAEITQFLPVESVNGTLVIYKRDLCIATAFFGQFFGTLIFYTQCSLALYLLLLTTSKNKENLHSRAREICGVIIAFTIASVMATIPLIPFDDGQTAYGLYGFSCWIEQKNDDCRQSPVGLIEHILLWYMPLSATIIFIMLALASAVKVMCVRPKRHLQPSVQHRYRQALQEARTLTMYMSILVILYLAEAIVNILYITSPGDDLTLRLSGFLIETVLFAFVPAAYIFHPGTLNKLKCHKLKQAVNKWRGIHDDEVYTSYHVPQEPEFSECSSLVITSSDRNRHDSSYQSIHERPITEVSEA